MKKKKEIENRFVDVFDSAQELELRDSQSLIKEANFSLEKSESTIENIKYLPGDYQIDEKTRGSKIDKKCLVCKDEIESIFELFHTSLILGSTSPVWTKTKYRCLNCHILYDF